jgi:hypothetical protein
VNIATDGLNIVAKLCLIQSKHRSTDEISQRWTPLFKKPLFVQKWLSDEPLISAEHKIVTKIIEN